MKRAILLGLVKFATVGFQIALCVSAGVILGILLDNRFSTKPFFIILGTLFGSFSAIAGIFKSLEIFDKIEKKSK